MGFSSAQYFSSQPEAVSQKLASQSLEVSFQLRLLTIRTAPSSDPIQTPSAPQTQSHTGHHSSLEKPGGAPQSLLEPQIISLPLPAPQPQPFLSLCSYSLPLRVQPQFPKSPASSSRLPPHPLWAWPWSLPDTPSPWPRERAENGFCGSLAPVQ